MGEFRLRLVALVAVGFAVIGCASAGGTQPPINVAAGGMAEDILAANREAMAGINSYQIEGTVESGLVDEETLLQDVTGRWQSPNDLHITLTAQGSTIEFVHSGGRIAGRGNGEPWQDISGHGEGTPFFAAVALNPPSGAEPQFVVDGTEASDYRV